jgi:hypothetical protein
MMVLAARADAPSARGLAVRGKGAFGASGWVRSRWSLTVGDAGKLQVLRFRPGCHEGLNGKQCGEALSI